MVTESMVRLSFPGYVIEVDRDATAFEHASGPAYGPEQCGCWYCRNWIAGRRSLLPAEVKTILDDLAILHDREDEVWEVPGEEAAHIYGGWYLFVGKLVVRPPVAANEFVVGGWRLSFGEGTRHAPYAFAGRQVVELHFVCDVDDFIDPAELDEPVR